MDRYKQIKIINDCNCLVDEKELIAAMNWYSTVRMKSVKKIFIHGKYPCVSVGKMKVHVHRLLMMYWEQRNLRPKEYVHHIDEDKLNATKENLQIFWSNEHQSYHNKGKRLSINHRKSISESNRRRKGIKHRQRVNVDLAELRKFLNEGKSIRWIAKFYKCDWTTIKSRIHDNPSLLKGE